MTASPAAPQLRRGVLGPLVLALLEQRERYGLEIVRELLKKADVMVENMAPGTIERLGLSYDQVKEITPGIIYCQIKGFGQGSPYEHSLAFDTLGAIR